MHSFTIQMYECLLIAKYWNKYCIYCGDYNRLGHCHWEGIINKHEDIFTWKYTHTHTHTLFQILNFKMSWS